ncbi:MAG: hypothetical protein R3A10_01620 [Caldilineaceae bacterium]
MTLAAGLLAHAEALTGWAFHGQLVQAAATASWAPAHICWGVGKLLRWCVCRAWVGGVI